MIKREQNLGGGAKDVKRY